MENKFDKLFALVEKMNSELTVVKSTLSTEIVSVKDTIAELSRTVTSNSSELQASA